MCVAGGGRVVVCVCVSGLGKLLRKVISHEQGEQGSDLFILWLVKALPLFVGRTERFGSSQLGRRLVLVG